MYFYFKIHWEGQFPSFSPWPKQHVSPRKLLVKKVCGFYEYKRWSDVFSILTWWEALLKRCHRSVHYLECQLVQNVVMWLKNSCDLVVKCLTSVHAAHFPSHYNRWCSAAASMAAPSCLGFIPRAGVCVAPKRLHSISGVIYFTWYSRSRAGYNCQQQTRDQSVELIKQSSDFLAWRASCVSPYTTKGSAVP